MLVSAGLQLFSEVLVDLMAIPMETVYLGRKTVFIWRTGQKQSIYLVEGLVVLLAMIAITGRDYAQLIALS